MNDELFNELVLSVREAGEIRRGERAASRRFVYAGHVLTAIEENGERVWDLERAAGELEARHSDVAATSADGIKTLRAELRQSQEGFAEMLNIPVGTLRGWEQGRRKPTGPAETLLKVAAKYPSALLDVALHV